MNKWIYVFLLSSNLAIGQDVILNSNASNLIQLSGKFELYVPQNQNQYIAPQWSKGKLFYVNGTSKKYDSLNFDRYGNTIEVVVNNKALSVLPMGLSGGLIYNSGNTGSLLVVAKIADQFRFLLVLSTGKHILASYIVSTEPIDELTYKLDGVRFVPKRKAEGVIREHYAIYDNGSWVGFKLNKSSLSKLFKVDKKVLQSNAASAGINISGKQGLVQLFQQLNDN